MLDGHLLVDAHVHAARLPTLRPAWMQWAADYAPVGVLSEVYDTDGAVVPELLDLHFARQGVDIALLFCEYSPKVTGYQPIEDVLPIVKYNPERFRPVANVNPHLHFPVAAELDRQLDLGAVALKIHPVHAGFSPDDAAMYPAYQVCRERGVPVVMHCGTSSFPGSNNRYADPVLLDPVLRDFPDVHFVLAHGGRGWWYDAAAFLALSRPNVWLEVSGLPPQPLYASSPLPQTGRLMIKDEDVWIELAGLPPKKLPEYYARYDLNRLARKWIFATDWPGVPGVDQNARAIAALGLAEDVVSLVLGGNALRVYGLDRKSG